MLLRYPGVYESGVKTANENIRIASGTTAAHGTPFLLDEVPVIKHKVIQERYKRKKFDNYPCADGW